ncbi:hypothetical protein OMAG_001141 [Candidatus Omnitrophus magneticus]|uniref:Uncharacterized protein n=1 Tax=Candidatus Omnitrophus magneticus TaxID=1609969 RepID=A0A0F0CP03_9BACT|nr:hypothetical protein OMAG_001141 [Candidatus Omnitrophus magneticus]
MRHIPSRWKYCPAYIGDPARICLEGGVCPMKMKFNEAVTVEERIRRKAVQRRWWKGNAEMRKKRRMKAGMIRFIRRKRYTMFISITFRLNVSQLKTPAECVKTCVACFFKHLNTPQEQFFERYIIMFYHIERHNLSDRVHAHLLVPDIEPILAPRLEEILSTKRCRRARCVQDRITDKDEKYLDDPYREVIGKEIMVYMYRSRRHAGYLGKKYGSEKVQEWGYMRINSRYRGSRPSTGGVKHAQRSSTT